MPSGGVVPRCSAGRPVASFMNPSRIPRQERLWLDAGRTISRDPSRLRRSTSGRFVVVRSGHLPAGGPRRGGGCAEFGAAPAGQCPQDVNFSCSRESRAGGRPHERRPNAMDGIHPASRDA